jgi:steroid delta-isomerase-like uncharacterized protein
MKLSILASSLALLFMASVVRADDSHIIQAWVDAWNAHDPDQVASLFASDAIYLDVPFNIKSVGTEQIRDFAGSFFSITPDVHIQLVRGVLNNHHGTIEWTISGTDVGIFGTGKTYSFAGVSVIDTKHNLITNNLDYYDLETLLCELGLGTVCIPH